MLVCTNSSNTQAEARLKDDDLKFNGSVKILHTEDKQRIPGLQQIALHGFWNITHSITVNQFDALQIPVPNAKQQEALKIFKLRGCQK